MKILFVLTYYRPHWTGLTQYAARLAEGLAEKGHQVEVLCSQHQKDLSSREVLNKVLITRLPYQLKFLRSVISLNFSFVLWRKIKESESVVVYLPLQEVLLAALYCRLLRKKLFLVHNGDLVLPQDCGLFCRLVEKIYFLSTAYAIKIAKRIIIQTQDYAANSNLLKQYRHKWAVILPLFKIPSINQKQIEGFKKKYKLENKILIGYSGRFVEEKGVDYLLQAIPLVLKTIPQAHFVFAGDYQIKYERYWDQIKDLIAKYDHNLTLLGLVKDPIELLSYYKLLAVYVQPSRTDCFPSSQVEALLSGIPSVCTNIPGARWVIEESGMGVLVEPQKPTSLAEGIIKVIRNRNDYLRLDKIKPIFDYQKTLNAYERLFAKS